jgi:DNA gyrase subunit A
MAILRHVEATGEERAGYLKMRRAITGEQAGPAEPNGEGASAEADEETVSAESLSLERYTDMSAQEQFILTLSEKGFGKRTSSYEYRITGRGGKGITAMAVNSRNGQLVGSFPVENEDQIMLVTDGGQLIRVPVDGIRIVGRSSQGVTVFSTRDKEKVVSVEHIEGEDVEAADSDDMPETGEEKGYEEGA